MEHKTYNNTIYNIKHTIYNILITTIQYNIQQYNMQQYDLRQYNIQQYNRQHKTYTTLFVYQSHHFFPLSGTPPISFVYYTTFCVCFTHCVTHTPSSFRATICIYSVQCTISYTFSNGH